MIESAVNIELVRGNFLDSRSRSNYKYGRLEEARIHLVRAGAGAWRNPTIHEYPVMSSGIQDACRQHNDSGKSAPAFSRSTGHRQAESQIENRAAISRRAANESGPLFRNTGSPA